MSEGLLEGDFGAEEVGGPLGEDAEVVLLEDLGGGGEGVSFCLLMGEGMGGGLLWEVGRGGERRDVVLLTDFAILEEEWWRRLCKL